MWYLIRDVIIIVKNEIKTLLTIQEKKTEKNFVSLFIANLNISNFSEKLKI